MNVREIKNRIDGIRKDEERGAAQLALEAVHLLGEMAADPDIPDEQFGDLFIDASKELAQARPSMASLLNAVEFVRTAWEEAGAACNPIRSRPAVAEAARRWDARQKAFATFVADHASEIVSGTVITLSYSSTILNALEGCWQREVLKRVIVAESRPLYEGRRTADALVGKGIPTLLITDASMGYFASEADVALVGADTIRPNGDLVNKSGTLLLALAARHCRIPFYTVSETHKITPNGRRRAPFSLEEKDPKEVLPKPIPGVVARNLCFDLTPARLLSGYITENGLLSQKDITAISRGKIRQVLATEY